MNMKISCGYFKYLLGVNDLISRILANIIQFINYIVRFYCLFLLFIFIFRYIFWYIFRYIFWYIFYFLKYFKFINKNCNNIVWYIYIWYSKIRNQLRIKPKKKEIVSILYFACISIDIIKYNIIGKVKMNIKMLNWLVKTQLINCVYTYILYIHVKNVSVI